MLPLVLSTLGRELHTKDKLPVWVNSQPTDDDLEHLFKEGGSASEFDPRGLRKQMLDDLVAKRAVLITRTCSLAKIMAVVYPEQIPRIPWDLFGSIFQAFGKGVKGWRLVWFANPTPRDLPQKGHVPSAYHVNGGYAKRCTPNSIVIYREEEVARVLIHELLHAACTDKIDSLEMIEAKTETWAELFLLAIIAKGRPRVLQNLWNIQSQWIVDQEELLKAYGVRSPCDYAWRYTVGRRHVLESLGCTLPKPKNTCTSLRFTSPLICL
jgi:hypothetical protein